METIKERINNGDLLNFSEEEQDFILQNLDLVLLFCKKIEEGFRYSLYDYKEELINGLLKYIDISKLLKNGLMHEDEFIIDLFSQYSEDSIMEFEKEFPGSSSKIKEFYQNNKDKINNLILNNIDKVYSVSNIDIINEMINKDKINFKHIYISENNLTKEIEEFIINKLKEELFQFNFFSENIFNYCKENNICYTLSSMHYKHPEIVPYILKEMDNDLITNSDLIDYSFLLTYRDTYEVQKFELINNLVASLYLIDLDKYPNLTPYVIDYLKQNDRQIPTNLLSIPEIFNLYLERTNENYYSITLYHEENLLNSEKKDINALVKSLSIYLDNNVSQIKNFLSDQLEKEIKEEYYDLIKREASKLSFEQCYKLYKNILLKQKDVPLSLSVIFDEELRRNSTYDINTLSTNPNFYFLANPLANYPDDFREFIDEAIKNGVLIDYDILYYANMLDRINQVNLTCQDSRYEFILCTSINNYGLNFEKILKLKKPAYILENNLLCTNTLRKIISNEEIFKIYYDYIKDEDLKNNSIILLALHNDYQDKEFDNNIKQYVKNSIKNNKIIIDNNMFFKKLLEIDDKEIEAFFIKNYFEKTKDFSSLIDNKIFNSIKEKEVYYNAFLNNLRNNPNILSYKRYLINDPNMIELYKEYVSNNEISNDFILDDIDYIPEVMQMILQKNEFLVNNYISTIIHNRQNTPISDEENNIIINTFSKLNLLPIENINALHNLYGNDLIRLLENQNILDLLKSNDVERINRFNEIFKVRDMNIKVVEAVNDSIKQNVFTKEHPEIINIFSNTMENIQNGISEDEINNLINELCIIDDNGNYLYLPKRLVFQIPDNINEQDKDIINSLLLLYQSDKNEFFRLLITKIHDNQNIYGGLLHSITSNYIKEKRNEVTRNEDIYNDTNIDFTYDSKQKKDAVFKYILKKGDPAIYNFIERFGVDKDIKKLHLNTYKLLRYGEENISPEELVAAKKNIKNFKLFILDCVEKNDSIDRIPEEEFINVKKIPHFNKREKIYQEVGDINFTSVLKIIDDDEKYECLLSILDKLKILEWDNLFDESIYSLSLGNNNIRIYNFINSFNTIYESEMKNNKRKRDRFITNTVNEMKQNNVSTDEINNYISLKEKEPYTLSFSAFNVLKYAAMYSSISNCYKILLGVEDANLIETNPPGNSAPASIDERLTFDTELMLSLMQNNEITIPSFVHDYSFDDERHGLKILVGCRGDSRNLTHGERTGACMRAKGVGHSLFNFTNTDPRGFHLTFIDSTTGNYISRVSGFRNGNTVFLNQLRYSLDSINFSDKDLYEALASVSNEIINKSKDSNMPIENVVCSPMIALENYKTEHILERNNITDGLFEGWRDVNNNAVIIATSSKDTPFAPVKLDADNQPTYTPCRLPIRRFKNQEINSEVKILIQRIDAIKECIENNNILDYYKTIDFDFSIIDENFKYLILGQDFYVALTNDNKIINNIAVESIEGKKEYNDALKEIESIKLGGITYDEQIQEEIGKSL